MSQAGFTPISLYYSATATNAPTAGNLVAGELAINTVDEKLYFKNSAGVVKVIASTAASTPGVTYIHTSSTTNILTTATTLTSNVPYECDTSGGVFTVTLPATPNVGDWLMITDHAGVFATNNLTVANNGSNIQSIAEALTLDLNNITVLIVYINSTKGWAVK